MASYYYSGGAAQQSRQVQEAQDRILLGREDPDLVKSQYPSALSGRIAMAIDRDREFIGEAFQARQTISTRLARGEATIPISLINEAFPDPKEREAVLGQPTNIVKASIGPTRERAAQLQTVDLTKVKTIPSTKDLLYNQDTFMGRRLKAALPTSQIGPTRIRAASIPSPRVPPQRQGLDTVDLSKVKVAKPKRVEYKGLTQKESTALRRSQNPLFRFASTAKGFLFEDPATLNKNLMTAKPAESFGAVFGLGLTIIPAGKAGKAVKATKKGFTAAKRTFQAVSKASQKTRLTRFLRYIGIQSASAVAITEGTKQVSRGTAPKGEKAAISGPGFQAALGAGFEAERASISKIESPEDATLLQKVGAFGKGGFKAIGYEISPFFSDKQSKAAFTEATRLQFMGQGLSGEALETAVKAAQRQKVAGGIGEAASLLSISRASEAFGRQEVRKTFAKLAKKGVTAPKGKIFNPTVFKKTFTPIGLAGFGEGFSQEIAQQRARERPTDFLEASAMGGFGFVSAGVIGGTIAATRVPKPGVSKAIEFGSYLTDPFEKPGDILQDITEAATRRLTRKTTAVPFIRQAFSPEDIVGVTIKKGSVRATRQVRKAVGSPIITFGVTPSQTITPTQTKGRSTPRPKGSIVPANIFSPTPVPIPTEVPTSFFGTPVRAKPRTIIPVPIKPPTPTPTTPTPIPTQIPTPIDIFNQINTNVPTPIPIPININIPTATPLLRVPPPLPLSFASDSGYGGSVKRKRRQYVNELEQGLKIFNKLVGGSLFGKPSKKRRK